MSDSLDSLTSRNRLLAALLTEEYQQFSSSLERIYLRVGQVLYHAGDHIEHVYFPENSVISLLSTMENGGTTEIGIIGREGMVGIEVFLAGSSMHDQALVQAAGTAMRMPAHVLSSILHSGSPLQSLLLRYTQTLLAAISQSAACNQHHSIEQRVARWLLAMSDTAETDELQFTHEVISNMIGSRRAGISEAASSLQDKGGIEYYRGSIRIVNRQMLEEAACECYGVIRGDFDRLYSSQLRASDHE